MGEDGGGEVEGVPNTPKVRERGSKKGRGIVEQIRVIMSGLETVFKKRKKRNKGQTWVFSRATQSTHKVKEPNDKRLNLHKALGQNLLGQKK